jgi:2-polyprenyl-6-hydroxyphenyl methylase/3-demethylubiquinone-9 3-methyltransferase
MTTAAASPPNTPAAVAGSTVDADEIARFAAMAEDWWNPAGKFRPLHRFNPTRLAFIRDRMAAHFGRDPLGPLRPFAGLRLLDIGCGGGLLSEPMARLGFDVVGIDAAEKNVRVAALHAEQGGLAIDYRHTTVEQLAAAGERFDAILNMEVVEHVADVTAFLGATATLLRPGGGMVVATLNRTPKAYLLAIVGAEYVLRWLPPGTHTWSKFVRPSELAAGLRPHGVTISEMTGVRYDPLAYEWSLAPRDLDVNYMVFAVKPQPP